MSNVLPAIYNMTGLKGLQKGRYFSRSLVMPYATSGINYTAAATNNKGEKAFDITVGNDELNNRLTLVVEAAALANVNPGLYDYDVKQVDTLGKPISVIQGKVEVSRTSTP
jgi:hypothetical protein